jgi:hypothetical protein
MRETRKVSEVADTRLKRAPGERRYYELAPDMSLSTQPERVWVNDEKLREGFQSDPNKPFRNLHFSEPPKIAFKRKKGRGRLRDAYSIMLGIWLVSDRLKVLLKRLDPDAFAFVQAEVDYSNLDEPGPAMWFCDIVRMLDCVDEEHSVIRYQQGIPWKNYLGLVDVKMRPEVVGSAHAFRLTFSTLAQIVDDVFVAAVKREKMIGFHFVDIQRR